MSEIEKLHMIAEWQEQYKQLIEDLDNSKKQIADLEWQLQQVIEDNDYYQKENEELQEENEKAKTKSFEEQLEYAKTIIQDLLDNSDEYARERAINFLKESE